MRSVLRFIVWTAIFMGALVGLARATAIRWWQVPLDDPWLGASVAPTLQPGDWVILWRLTRPTEGDLVKCPEPKAPERIVLGRVLGTANDQVEFDRGQLRINGRSPPTERRCDEFEIAHPKTGEPFRQGCRVEDLNGTLYMRGNVIPELPAPLPTAPSTVEPGQFFLVSDNRQFPFDSRDYGTVEVASCTETVIYRVWGKRGYFDRSRRFELVR
jgi:signal peptidase I